MYRGSSSDERPLLVVALNGKLLALDRRDGRIRWRHDLFTPGPVEITVWRERVFAVTADGRLHHCRYLDGGELERVELSGSYHGRATMLVDGDQLFIASGGEVACVGVDGREIWFNGLRGMGIAPTALAFPGHERQADVSR